MSDKIKKETLVSTKVGERMRARRKELGLSMDEVSKGTGISTTQLHKYETGLSNMYCEKMIEIADFLSVAPSYFLEEKLTRQDRFKLLGHFDRLKHSKIRELIIVTAEKACEIDELIKA